MTELVIHGPVVRGYTKVRSATTDKQPLTLCGLVSTKGTKSRKHEIAYDFRMQEPSCRSCAAALSKYPQLIAVLRRIGAEVDRAALGEGER